MRFLFVNTQSRAGQAQTPFPLVGIHLSSRPLPALETSRVWPATSLPARPPLSLLMHTCCHIRGCGPQVPRRFPQSAWVLGYLAGEWGEGAKQTHTPLLRPTCPREALAQKGRKTRGQGLGGCLTAVLYSRGSRVCLLRSCLSHVQPPCTLRPGLAYSRKEE